MNINATLLAQAIMFGLFVWFTMRFVWPPITSALLVRQKQIADGLAAADRGKHELELAAKKATQELRTAKEKASEIIALADKRASEIIEEAKANAKNEGDRIVAGAKAEIDQEVNRAKEGLRQQVATLAIAGAEKILRREIDAKAHADMLSVIANEL
ncbi:MAG: F0F1 ATP synthase subunit B [Methylophilaceae bacterium]|nr:F0F1 ATP synthase subunit B [Methylophilaceae bacterium]